MSMGGRGRGAAAALALVVCAVWSTRAAHAAPFAIDPFRCYQANPTLGAPKFAPLAGVHVADAFENVLVDVKKPRLLCAPADTTADGIADGATHLEAYQLKLPKGQARHTPRTRFGVATQIGTFVVDTVKAELLLVPTNANPAVTPPQPDPTAHEVDHFNCYKAKLAKGEPKLATSLEVTATDERTIPPQRLSVRKVRHLCLPADKNDEGTKHENHLLCFTTKATKGRCAAVAPVNADGGCKRETDCGGVKGQTTLCTPQAKFVKQTALRTANQFDSEQLDLKRADELCLTAFPVP